MAAYRRVYYSRHLQANCQEPGSASNPTLGNRVWATFLVRSVIRNLSSLTKDRVHSRTMRTTFNANLSYDADNICGKYGKYVLYMELTISEIQNDSHEMPTMRYSKKTA